MRITDDLHALTTAATRAVDLFERYLQLRLAIYERTAAAIGETLNAPKYPPYTLEPAQMTGPTYYDDAMNQRLNAATERYVTEHGEWPTEEMRADFINEGIDFSQL